MNQKQSGSQPVQSPRARFLALVIGLVLLALCFVAVRDTVIWYRVSPNDGWIFTAWQWLSGLDSISLAVVSSVAILIGLYFFVGAFLPRKKRYRRLPATTASTWVRRVDIARMTTALATAHPEVITASSIAKKKIVSVTAAVAAPSPELQAMLTDSLSVTLKELFGDLISVSLTLREADPRDVNEARIASKNAQGRNIE